MTARKSLNVEKMCGHRPHLQLRQFAREDDRFGNFPHGSAGFHALLLESLVGFFLAEIGLPLQDALGALDQFAGEQGFLALLNGDAQLGIFEGQRDLVRDGRNKRRSSFEKALSCSE